LVFIFLSVKIPNKEVGQNPQTGYSHKKCSIRHNHLTMNASSGPQDRAMLRKFIIADAAAGLFMNFKECGISGEDTCTWQDKTMTAAMSREAANIEKLMYTKAIAFMASKALDRPINGVTAKYMYKVLIKEGHDSDVFKRVHGKAFPRELTDDGWRSSFKALHDYVELWFD
jgi:hypothetical protein